MTVVGVPRAAFSGMRGIDALTLLLRPQLVALRETEGVKWVGTYLGVCTPAYRDLCFNLGLGLALLIRPIVGAVTAAMGQRLGAETCLELGKLEAPPGLHVTIDQEDQTGDVAGHVDGCAEVLRDHGARSMLYLGMPSGFTAESAQLALPDRYWRSCSLQAPEPLRRSCVLQLRPGNVPFMGALIDRDVIEADALGDTPVLWWPQ